MARSVLRLLAVTVVLAHVAVACDGGDLNPQPLPPVDNSGKGAGGEPPATGGESTGDSATGGGGDAGIPAPPDGGDGGDAGDAGDGGK